MVWAKSEVGIVVVTSFGIFLGGKCLISYLFIFKISVIIIARMKSYLLFFVFLLLLLPG